MEEYNGVIIKFIKGKYNKDRSIGNVIKYILCENGKAKDDIVGRGGQYVDYSNAKNAIRQFKCVQRAYGKDSGKRLRHIMISFPRSCKSIKKTRKIVKIICQDFFYEYQMLFGIHEDDGGLHAHIALNTVSYLNGKKWHVSLREFDELKKGIANRVLEEMGRI